VFNEAGGVTEIHEQ
jgi:hypothetical protein